MKTKGSTDPASRKLDQEARGIVRSQYAGKWLAWSEDERELIGVGETPAAVRIAAIEAGHPRFIDDWVPLRDCRQTTGLE